MLMTIAGLFLLALVVLVVCAGLQINPFRETTTSFLISVFFGLIGAAAILVLLNVAASISLIAESRVAELQLQPEGHVTKRWTLMFLVAACIAVAAVALGTYYSKERYIGIVRKQADEVVSQNRAQLEELGQLLNSDKFEDRKRVSEIQAFLANRRRDLPQMTLIYPGKFEDKLVFFRTRDYSFGNFGDAADDHRLYYTCVRGTDCDYLTKFFSGQSEEVMQKYSWRDERFFIYVPVTTAAGRFVLLFDRWNSFGKIGS